MAIKKVVLKEKTIKNKPYFNDDNIYIWQRGCNDFLKLIKYNDKFKWSWLNNSITTLEEYDSFEEVVDNIWHGDLYIFNNINQVAHLLNRNYSHIDYCKYIKETSNIADDEVSIDDISKDCTYANRLYNNSILLLTVLNNGSFGFTSLLSTCNGYYSIIKPSIREAIEKMIKEGKTVYQFDTQEEFLEWALDAVRNNKQYKY